MRETSGPALEEIIADFSRAKEELLGITETFREINGVAEDRKKERDTLSGATAQLTDSSVKIAQLVEQLLGTVSSVSVVLAAAEQALKGTDASQINQKIDVIDSEVKKTSEVAGATANTLKDISKDLSKNTQSMVNRLEGVQEATAKHFSNLEQKVGGLEQLLSDRAELEEDRRQLQGQVVALQKQIDAVRNGLKPSQIKKLGLDMLSST